MRALLLATGNCAGMEELTERTCSPLLQIAAKPIIIHILERLHVLGIKECALLVDEGSKPLILELEKGARWGMAITYHPLANRQSPLELASELVRGWGEEPFLFGTADQMPHLESTSLLHPVKDVAKLAFYPSHAWSEWGLFSPSLFQRFSRSQEMNMIPYHLHGEYEEIHTHCHLSVKGYSKFQYHNIQSLRSKDIVFPATAAEKKPSLWISPNIKLHPSVTLIPPLFIGEACQIEKGVTLGPDVVMEKGCIVDRGTTIEQTVVCSQSYVGEGLQVRYSIIDRRHCIRLDLNASLTIDDPKILGEVRWNGK